MIGFASAQDDAPDPTPTPPTDGDEVLQGEDAPQGGELVPETPGDILQDVAGAGGNAQAGTAAQGSSIGELATRLLGGNYTVRRPLEKGGAFTYDPDPELLDHRTQELMATLGERRISLLEAVKITLERAPEIKLAREDVVASEGAVQSAAGQFDVRVSAGASYFRGQQELDVRGVEAGQRSFDRDKGFVKAANEAIEDITEEIQFIRDGGTPSSRFVRNPDGSVVVIGTIGGDLDNPDAPNIGIGTADGLADQQRQLDAELVRLARELAANPAETSQIAEIEKQFIEEGIANRKFVRHILKENVTQALKRIEKFPPNSILRTDVVTYDLAFVKQFRNGSILRPYLEFTREQDHLSRRRGKAAENRTEFGLQLTIPLGKGRGYLATTGGEIASGFELDASRYELQHAIALQVLETTTAYWQVVAAQERLTLLLESEMISGTILNLADAMIAQDIIPAAVRGQAVAREGTARAARIRAEFDLFRAQQNLVIAMGYDGDDIINAPLAADPFPPLIPATAVEAQDLESLVRQASFKRADRNAAVHQKIASAVLVDQARANLKPRCDLQLGISYAGLDEGGQFETLYTPYQEGHSGSGPSGFFSLRADWPFENRIPRSELALFEARGRKLQETVGIIVRSIDSGITTARHQVRNAAVFYAFEIASMEQTKLALQGENEKLKLGTSTVVDSILAEERLTNSKSGLVDARLQQALGLAQLRFESGTLLSGESDSPQILWENLVTLPPVEMSAPKATLVDDEAEARKTWTNTSPWRRRGFGAGGAGS